MRQLSELEPPIDVDIVGFGLADDAHETLNEMALAAGDDGYYQTETIEELVQTLFTLGVQKAPCKFDLDELPEPDDLVVLVDGVRSFGVASPGRAFRGTRTTRPPARFSSAVRAARLFGTVSPIRLWFETRS